MNSLVQHIASLLDDLYDRDEAIALAWWVAEETTGMNRTQLQFGCKDTTFSADMQAAVERLRNFEPIQYIFGHTLWGGLDLRLTPATLIPRPETAELVGVIGRFAEGEKTEAGSLKDQKIHVLDIGTGSGCIAIALKKAHPEWQVEGVDISAEAVGVAQENGRRNGADVSFRQCDVFSDETERLFETHRQDVHLIVSNPPYICEGEKPAMRRNVLDYEPHGALFVPDDDPLRYYRRIAELSARARHFLFFEINEAYSERLQAMLEAMGYSDIHLYTDSYGKARFVSCRMA